MNSAPHLPDEDRRDFERVLDEALRAAPHREDSTRTTGATGAAGLTAEQLRRMALGATSLITAAAASEYHQYVKLRAELRTPRAVTAPLRGPHRRGRRGLGALAPNAADAAEPGGAGLVAVVAALAPVLAGAAAVIFLLVGYIVELAGPDPAFAATLLTTGWVFGAITAVAILAAATGLLLTALRNTATSLRADEREAPDAELARARDAWRQALLERGILPFLQNALPTTTGTESAPAPPARTRPRPRPQGRMPQLGYHSPEFSSPNFGHRSDPDHPADSGHTSGSGHTSDSGRTSGSGSAAGAGPHSAASNSRGPDGAGPDAAAPNSRGPGGAAPDNEGPDGAGPDGAGPVREKRDHRSE